jgi:MFS transporter, DHA1 family, inner membrane transport protein
LGSVWMARNIDRIGAARFVGFCLIATVAALLIWPLASFGFAAALVIALLWGAPGFATNGAQQARVVGIAGAQAPVAVACNSSAIYLGQALGTVIGGAYYANAPKLYLPWLAACFVLAAWFLSRKLHAEQGK